MKRILISALAVVAVVGLAVPTAALAESGIKSQQVQFAKGRSSAQVEGNIVGNAVAD
jgi:hypothetical protein